LLSLEEAGLGGREPEQILNGWGIWVSDMARCDVDVWDVGVRISRPGGVLTNLSNLRIAVVKELHQLEMEISL
jgi:hypothetical protein